MSMEVFVSGPGDDEASVELEHQVQLELLDALCRTSRSGSAEDAREILEQAMDYCDAHFMSEQLLMRLCSYPEFDAHVQDHERMMEALEAMSAKLPTGGPVDAAEAERLREVLLRHIGNRDRAFVEYYRGWRRAEPATGPRDPA